MPSLVLISDTHLKDFAALVPPGDILIHAGDLTSGGTLAELERAAEQLAALPHALKVVIAGNHDFCCERQAPAARRLLERFVYLEDTAFIHAGIKFYGSPWQPFFRNWAFNVPRGAALAAKWREIPDDVDVLVTHGPPVGVLDLVHNGEHVGCKDLWRRVESVRPPLHVFGHIHEAYGVETREWDDGRRTLFVNASTCSLRYQAVQTPIVVTCERASDGKVRFEV